MSFNELPTPDVKLDALIAQALEKFNGYPAGADRRWLLVDVFEQRLVLVQGNTPRGAWPVSTAQAGLDNRQDSGGTPPGAHQVVHKIGTGSPVGTVFDSREPTGQIWRPDDNGRSDHDQPDDLILTRILTLAGCEPGLNQGPGIDSQERYIYLHGTNDEQHIGEPVSHGCVRLTNADICDVFDQIQEGDPVVII